VIYLDNNATTELLPEVREAVLHAMSFGPANPSSPHTAGEPARRLLADAHEAVASLIGASSEEVFFTSGGTEANNWVLDLILTCQKRHLIVTPVEHESVLRKAEILESQGVVVNNLPVDCNGVVCLEAAKEMINDQVGMVSVQWVNNETGVVQPVKELLSICKERGVLFHTDAAQAVGKIELDVRSIPVDYLTFTGHKIHAPMGIGVLYRRHGASLMPFLRGGMQEMGQRPGSQNLIGIAGLAEAARIRKQRMTNVQEDLAKIRDLFDSLILSSCVGACLNTEASVPRVANTTNVRFTGINGEAFLARLIGAGICCSQGSACTSQIPEPSHTLLAMGLSREEAYQSIRFSFSELNSIPEVRLAAESISAEYNNLKKVFLSIVSTGGIG